MAAYLSFLLCIDCSFSTILSSSVVTFMAVFPGCSTFLAWVNQLLPFEKWRPRIFTVPTLAGKFCAHKLFGYIMQRPSLQFFLHQLPIQYFWQSWICMYPTTIYVFCISVKYLMDLFLPVLSSFTLSRYMMCGTELTWPQLLCESRPITLCYITSFVYFWSKTCWFSHTGHPGHIPLMEPSHCHQEPSHAIAALQTGSRPL